MLRTRTRASHAALRLARPTAARAFHPSPVVLDASIISGLKLAKSIRSNIANKVLAYNHDKFGTTNATFDTIRFKPNLTIIQVGSRPDSSAYVNSKLKAAKSSNINSRLLKFDEHITEEQLLEEVQNINNDPKVHGLLIQLPLPPHINETLVTNAVSTDKDVDGFGRFNVGELAKRGGRPLFKPCTPSGVIELIRTTGVDMRGKNAVVLGRSDIVGNPVAAMLKNEDCTVTICHRHTKDLPQLLGRADIVVAAIGMPEYVKGEWLKEDAIVVDVGINYKADAAAKNGRKLVGDVDFSSAVQKVQYLTPVPGGVGPMTVAMLCSNVFDAAMLQEQKNHQHAFKPLHLALQDPVPSDIAISRAQQPKKITKIAQELGLLENELEPYGHYKAKVDPKMVISRLDDFAEGSIQEKGNYVLVAGITPTPLGEGKSTTTMGLTQALGAHLGYNSIANVRQPSMGPTFGVKGGAAGGGYSQVIPMDEFNMHLTGDIHAISAAQNLLCAAVDTRMFHEYTSKSIKGFYKRLVPVKKGSRTFTPSMIARLQKLGIHKTNPDELTDVEITKFAKLDIDPESISIKRVVDCNDRFVREITIGEGKNEASKFPPRKSGMDITVASELMAILALSTSLKDMRQRIGKIVVGTQRETGEVITCEDIGAAGALTALLKDAIKPNLMQTLEGTPVFVHAGPFANISIGASSVIADRLALKLTSPSNPTNNGEKGFVVTEAGFDFTMGGERFFNIKCRASGYKPDAVVLVATSRALKLHGGAPDVKPGQSLPAEYLTENLEFLQKGCANLAKQIQNVKQYNVPVVVAINQFETDTAAELELIKVEAKKAGADFAAVTNHWAKGGEGALELAKAVTEAVEIPKSTEQSFLYDVNSSVEDKILTIAQKMYGAANIELSPLARKQVETYTQQGYDKLPICIAKTQYSLSHDPSLKGVPTGFTIPIREVRCSAGAGYLYALAAEITTIPGLPTHAGFMNVEVNEDGQIDGLF
ncbi:mitochondrial C1- tetrahydrofolate synthase precursor [Yamadazyma tenuis]|uniref:C-1-tetrahydrofolate synthase mitochondrial n=1 Tax=Candida tenuis (strain ATCC 10573 / BCRC 21748 / CBS 615 / JCM 9827 / NBRC 10315 / NRRL Y-1498 / VKM Y-70) TaxID=590646 RepID=G3BBG4_CANTC|nr:C-1-tetrahydrofolate synthase mitochondrial precursor [Yamadazyma tenuis ATCC 10573]EGV62184.1 C-1-tetrahydrofolate synthase mitochondrial precursor [Yamadazyma tenuis ATCC 10573]WEJ93442.1 mitochondrial C1- tetrahydrofolate synthase precursor [Yamadazyma tenuis]